MSHRTMVASGRLSAAIRWGHHPDVIQAAREELAEARLEDRIRDALPLLTPEARWRLAVLLRRPVRGPVPDDEDLI